MWGKDMASLKPKFSYMNTNEKFLLKANFSAYQY